jgi:hypothetical protein
MQFRSSERALFLKRSIRSDLLDASALDANPLQRDTNLAFRFRVSDKIYADSSIIHERVRSTPLRYGKGRLGSLGKRTLERKLVLVGITNFLLPSPRPPARRFLRCLRRGSSPCEKASSDARVGGTISRKCIFAFRGNVQAEVGSYVDDDDDDYGGACCFFVGIKVTHRPVLRGLIISTSTHCRLHRGFYF